ncbi:polyketide synthase dehydratase domain-containing protein, partial [Bacillus wiedmannii]
LTKEEFYLADHKIEEQTILPGAAYIEMARAAGEIAGERKVRSIQNVNWLRPITLTDAPCKVEIRLYPDGEAVQYEISTRVEEEQIINAQGKLLYESSELNMQPQDINVIKDRCSNVINGKECYDLFQKAGFIYGNTFQSIQRLYSNEHEALSYLKLPPQCVEDFDKFVLHPSLMDGAFQTLLGLVNSVRSESTMLYVPFSVKEVKIEGPLKEACYVYVTFVENKNNNKTFNLQMLDKDGRVLVGIKHL